MVLVFTHCSESKEELAANPEFKENRYIESACKSVANWTTIDSKGSDVREGYARILGTILHTVAKNRGEAYRNEKLRESEEWYDAMMEQGKTMRNPTAFAEVLTVLCGVRVGQCSREAAEEKVKKIADELRKRRRLEDEKQKAEEEAKEAEGELEALLACMAASFILGRFKFNGREVLRGLTKSKGF